ncbi:ATP-binding cassette sub- D member 1 [Coemansia sp. RSA 2399]|nr:ATP-binding cassette sub- D member 1 [Coemansia sp. RSA 2399]KAJ1907961.1 ATP-binding cassette sub- D member 1 [Coemansia sp. IMI 209127]
MTDDSSGAEPKDGFLGIQVIASGSLPLQPAAESESAIEDQGQRIESPDAIIFDKVTIEQGTAGSQKRRAKHFTSLTMQIDRGHHCLVVGSQVERRRTFKAVLLGSSGAHITKGTLRSPKPHVGILYIDSRPYIKSGSSLWELLIFPHDKMQSVRRGISERHLVAILRFMDFEHLLAHVGDNWGQVVDWSKVLNKHELLAVSVCRMIYHAPAFALVDDALALLDQGQVRQLFAAAKYHHVTMLVSAEYDPFDAERVSSRRCESADSLAGKDESCAFMPCIGEFARALRLSKDGVAQNDMPWSFCLFGYGSSERPAFDVTEERAYLWNSMYTSLEESYVSRLQRRTSTLSQCSTTERHWLMTPDTPSASTVFSSDSTVSRRQSHAIMSPALTARSSISDFSVSTLRRTMSSDLVRSRSSRVRTTIDGALSGFISPPPGSANAGRSPSAFGALEKRQQPPLSVASTLSTPPSSASVAGSVISSEPSVDDYIAEEDDEEINKQSAEVTENQPKANVEPELKETEEPKEPVAAVADDPTNTNELPEVCAPPSDNNNEASSDNNGADQPEQENEYAEKEKKEADAAGSSAPESPMETQAHARNPYARSKRSYARPQRSQFGQPGNQSLHKQSSSGPSFIPPPSSATIDRPPQDTTTTNGSRPFSRIEKGSPTLNTSTASLQTSSPSRTYARASPRKNATNVGSSRIPRPPVSGSASSSKSNNSEGSAI